MSAVLINEVNTVCYSYKNYTEFLEHRVTMENSHWVFEDIFSDNNDILCARYTKVIKSRTKTVRDIVTNCHSKTVVIVTKDGEVLYNDKVIDLLTPNVIGNNLLLRRTVLTYTEQNDIIKVVV